MTFLFTDIEGSTRKAHELGDAWFGVLQTHHEILRPVFASYDGLEVSTAGDSFFVVFRDAGNAVNASVAMQRAISEHDWSPHPQLRVRMGLHTGEAHFSNDDYAGLTVHAASRVESAAAGAQVLLTAATWDAAVASGTLGGDVGVIDLGAHQLKDLPEPTPILQLTATGLPRDFPPLRSLTEAPNNLIRPASRFVGRTEELLRCHQILDDDRLLSIVGPGGIGKTRLATQVAWERVLRHADGVWFVSLDTAHDAVGVVAALAEAVGVRERGPRPLLDETVSHLRDSKTLLVIDNSEHVVDAVAQVVETLLSHTHHVRVLTTTREALRIDGERVWRLEPLGIDPKNPTASDAVELFADRVERLNPGFQFTTELAASAADIVVRLDGLPLAIELAAARSDELTIPEIAAQIDDRFELLSHGSRTAVDRQKTLWNAIDWSYGLLSSEDQAFARRLAVFPASFDVAAVTGVYADAVDADKALERLVAKSVAKDIGPSRVRLLDSIRQYLRAQRSADEVQVTERQHAVWVTDAFAVMHETFLDMEWLDTVSADLEAAMEWSEGHDGYRQLLALVGLQRFWLRKGRYSEGRGRSSSVLAATTNVRERIRWNALGNAGQLALMQSDSAAARAYILEAAEEARAIGGTQDAQMVLTDLGALAVAEADYELAITTYEATVATAKESGNDRVAIVCLAHLAEIAQMTGDLDASDAYRAVGTELAAAIGWNDLVTVLTQIGATVNRRRGAIEAARTTFAELLATHRAADDIEQVPYVLTSLALMAIADDALNDAAALLAEAVDLSVAIDSPSDLVEAIEALAALAAARDDRESLGRLVATADAQRLTIGLRRPPADETGWRTLMERATPVSLDPSTPASAVALEAVARWR